MLITLCSLHHIHYIVLSTLCSLLCVHYIVLITACYAHYIISVPYAKKITATTRKSLNL